MSKLKSTSNGVFVRRWFKWYWVVGSTAMPMKYDKYIKIKGRLYLEEDVVDAIKALESL